MRRYYSLSTLTPSLSCKSWLPVHSVIRARDWSLSEGVSVVLHSGRSFYVKELFVHKDNEGLNHAWFVGTCWSPTSNSVDNLRYPVLQKTDSLELLPCNLISSTFLTAHSCYFTLSERDHHRTISDTSTEALCWLNVEHGVSHNVRNNLYFQKPLWLK